MPKGDEEVVGIAKGSRDGKAGVLEKKGEGLREG